MWLYRISPVQHAHMRVCQDTPISPFLRIPSVPLLAFFARAKPPQQIWSPASQRQRCIQPTEQRCIADAVALLFRFLLLDRPHIVDGIAVPAAIGSSVIPSSSSSGYSQLGAFIPCMGFEERVAAVSLELPGEEPRF